MAAIATNGPRIGIPWRTSQEESKQERPRIQSYEDAVGRAGGVPVVLPLSDTAGLGQLLDGMDGFVLPGSPADVEPEEYGARDSGRSEPPDKPRERTDRAILEHAFREKKPVLAICYGCQLLNVYLGGTLIQDLRDEMGTTTAHRRKDVSPEPREDPEHGVLFEAGSLLARLAEGQESVVNSSHHQAVQVPGRQLKVTGLASDGIIEAIEWTGDTNWVVGVQWHPERMEDDALAQKLFAEFVAVAGAHKKTPAKH